MNESSTRDTLTFTVYLDIGSARYVLLAIVILIYLATVLANVTLMLLIFLDTSLHKPMYIFVFSLILNGLIGSTAVWPMVMKILLTNTPLISYEGCLIQTFIIITYGACTYSMLTVMAYDRFVSIFKPLQYHTIMTPKKVMQLLFVANFSPTALMFFQICLSSQLTLCRYKINKLYCDNLAITRLSCGDSQAIKHQVSNLYGIVNIILIVALPVVLILLSYVKIIMLSFKASRNARQKTFETCFPHIIIFINFSLVTLFSLLYNRFNEYLPGQVNILNSINYILVPPLLHPIIYGLKTQEIRQRFSRAWRKTVRNHVNLL
ncbi:olfactory receptor 52E8-like [Alosa alosa]|uniref:olfactory receptor 52E8-like n=1 Tax=Alosa alosa TaxID=278164 RepID=UPI00201520AD|nr:olfactory receptor 52E8-like [Alosa alosa]